MVGIPCVIFIRPYSSTRTCLPFDVNELKLLSSCDSQAAKSTTRREAVALTVVLLPLSCETIYPHPPSLGFIDHCWIAYCLYSSRNIEVSFFF
jgi:hypothetical protein